MSGGGGDAGGDAGGGGGDAAALAPPTSTSPPTLAEGTTATPAAWTGVANGITAAPRKVNELPNVKVSIVFGIVDPYIDRMGETKRSLTSDKSLWRPIFDPGFGPAVQQGLAADWMQLCIDIANSSMVVPGQADSCTATVLGLLAGTLPNVDPLPTTCDGEIQWIHATFISTTPKSASPFAAYSAWEGWERFVDRLVIRHPFLTSAFATTPKWSTTVYIVLAIRGAMWSIVFSFLTSFAAVILFISEPRTVGIAMVCIVINLVMVVASFRLLGWELGAVEAVSFSVLVGTSVGCAIHFIEGYRCMDDDDAISADPVQARAARVKHAMSTVLVPIVSSAATTAGSAALLCATSLQPLRRFGQILVLNTTGSLTLTVLVTSSMLLLGGPTHVKISWKRFGMSMTVAVVMVVSVVAVVTAQNSGE